MNRARVMLLSLFGLSLISVSTLALPEPQRTAETAKPVIVFDVLNLPARIDEPKISGNGNEIKLNCAIANRSGEPLLGLRLVLMLIDNAGNDRRVTWSEQTELPPYSIKTFALHPPIPTEVSVADQSYLVVDEVIGSETIWRAVDVEKALRAFARGQHEVMPKIRAVANKYDRDQQGPPVIREEKE